MTFSFTGIDHIQVAGPKGCEEEAKRFYSGILGLKELPKPENLRARGGCWFQCGDQEIHVGIEEEFSPAKKAHPGLLVHNLLSLKQTLEEHHIPIKEEPPIQGRIRIHVSDPFGNRLEFLEFLNK
ncbi:VOC family protein [Heyndrickxia acidicola]|uniref:VOC family protein n=1 Tax=Heyndrickxia acidicola TaxID=209389 RepID=A0ABU6MBH5_9BACI|nr:VOC family protein [Heyndrickxia acidicola]MED1201991.1 VOC family protein [Heyndrickxia acidicola]